MIEKIHQKLSDSKVARWSVLALAAFTMFADTSLRCNGSA